MLERRGGLYKGPGHEENHADRLERNDRAAHPT